MKKFLRLTGWMLLIVVSTAVLLYFLHRPSLEVVAIWKQSSDIKYDGLGPYYLSVVEDDIDWRGFPLFVQRSHFIYAGRDSGTPSYGHMIDFSFDPMEDLPAFLSKAKVEWTAEGVRLNLASGHRLFIPEDMFTGGR